MTTTRTKLAWWAGYLAGAALTVWRVGEAVGCL
jgi:hypothetical protein